MGLSMRFLVFIAKHDTLSRNSFHLPLVLIFDKRVSFFPQKLHEKKHIHKRLFQLICPLTYASILAHFCKELSAKVIHVDKPNSSI